MLDSRIPEMGRDGQPVWSRSDYCHLSAGHGSAPSSSRRIRAFGGDYGPGSGEPLLGETEVPGQGGECGAEVTSVHVVVALTVEKILREDRNGLPGRHAVRSLSPGPDVLREPFDVTL